MYLKDDEVCLTNLSMYYTWKNKAQFTNNKMRYQKDQQQMRNVTST